MNTELQKKWFVYVSDHHEGPFTAVELSQKQKTGALTPQTFIWTEGMADWKPLSEIAELSRELKKLEGEKKAAPKKEEKTPRKKSKTFKITIAALVVLLVPILTLMVLSRTSSDELHASVRPTIRKIVDKMPMLLSVFHLVPSTGDLKGETRRELEVAQLGKPESGVRIAVALSQTDPSRPVLYFGSNLPDRTRLDVYIVGKSETLLNRLQYKGQILVSLTRGFAKSDPLLSENGQALAKGEYQIMITDSLDQDESAKALIAKYPANRPAGVLPDPLPNSAKFVLIKTTFIGGARDETYLTRLKAFHEKIKTNSENELIELRQYADTLALQYQTLGTEFEKILKAKKVTDAQKENWKKVSARWQEINAQLEQTIQTWSRETIQNEFYYGNAYELVKSAYESLRKLFSIENNFVEKPGDRAAFEIEHGKTVSETRQVLDQLKAKIEGILSAPKSANGLPKREGT